MDYSVPCLPGYTVHSLIGHGRFGSVYAATHTASRTPCAVKHIYIHQQYEHNVTYARADAKPLHNTQLVVPVQLLREVYALQYLTSTHSQHSIQLYDVQVQQNNSVCLVLELMHIDLYAVLKYVKAADYAVSLQLQKYIVYCIVQAVAELHGLSLIHRDVKPSNILFKLDGDNNTVSIKLSDFGLCRMYGFNTAVADTDTALHSDTAAGDSAADTNGYTHTVATRWYRAPELLFGSKQYTQSIDVWSVGCILCEVLEPTVNSAASKPLFAGQSDIDQISCVIDKLGSINDTTMPECATLPDYNKLQFSQNLNAVQWTELLPAIAEYSDSDRSSVIDLLQHVLCYDSSKRYTAQQLLSHAFFSDTVALQSDSKQMAALNAELAQLVQRCMKQHSDIA